MSRIVPSLKPLEKFFVGGEPFLSCQLAEAACNYFYIQRFVVADTFFTGLGICCLDGCLNKETS